MSSSGTLWKSSNAKKTSVAVEDVQVESGLTDLGCIKIAEEVGLSPSIPGDEKGSENPPVVPEPTLLKEFTWEPNMDLTGMIVERYHATTNNPKAYQGQYVGRLGTLNRSYDGHDFVVGDKYRLSGWVYGDALTRDNNFNMHSNHDKTISARGGVKGSWTFVNLEWTATHKTQNMIFSTNNGYWYLDEFTLEKV